MIPGTRNQLRNYQQRGYVYTKYAEHATQVILTQLWAIMLRNCADVFVWQCAGRKFLETLEDVITSTRTSPVVRERLLEVLAAAAFSGTSSK